MKGDFLSDLINEGSKESNKFTLSMSLSLRNTLLNKAEREGVSPEELACELISEGLVLRAWEIMERNKIMQKNTQGHNFKKTKTHNRRHNHNQYDNYKPHSQNLNNNKRFR